jgi:hypothetical protein
VRGRSSRGKSSGFDQGMLRPLGLFEITGETRDEAVFSFEAIFQASIVLIYLVCFFLFYPPTYAISDEAIYFGMAHVLSQGHVFPDEAAYYVPSTIHGAQHQISYPPLGWPLLLSILCKFGWHFFFLMPLALHLIGYYYFRKILSVLKIDPIFSFLYLLFPTFVFHSRTLMSDLPAAVFFLIGFYYSMQDQKRGLILAGICFGVSLWIRYASIFAVTPIIAVSFFREKNRIIPLLYGFIPLVILLGIYHYIAFGNPFVTGYDRIGISFASSFSFGFLLQHLPKYFLILNILYPLMLLSLLLYKGGRSLEIYSCVVIMVLFYSARFWFDSGATFAETAIKSLRFLLPIIPLLLVSYLYCMEKYIFSKLSASKKWSFAILGAISLSVIAGGIQFKHQEYLQRQKHFSDLIYKETSENSSIIANMEIIELLQPVWGKRNIIEYDLAAITAAAERNAADIYFITNNKIEKPELKYQNSYFLAELQKRYSVNKISSYDDRGWELSFYKLSIQPIVAILY